MPSEKFKNKYRISSARHPYHNYAKNGTYAVTICTKNREPLFGEVINKMMCVSEIGGIVDRFWREIPNHFPFVEPDLFIVMPNHIHGIVMINKTDEYWENLEMMKSLSEMEQLENGIFFPVEEASPTNDRGAINHISSSSIVETRHCQNDINSSIVETLQCNVSTQDNTSIQGDPSKPTLRDNPKEFYSSISPDKGSLSTIIRSFKSICTKTIHRQFPDVEFAWQERLYDRIIATEQELHKQRNYILTNPARWEEGEENIFRK